MASGSRGDACSPRGQRVGGLREPTTEFVLDALNCRLIGGAEPRTLEQTTAAATASAASRPAIAVRATDLANGNGRLTGVQMAEFTNAGETACRDGDCATDHRIHGCYSEIDWT